MTKKRQNTLTLAKIKKEVSDSKKFETYLIDKENNTVIKYRKVFNERDIELLIKELYEHIQYNIENNIGFFNNQLEFNAYVNFLIIKYFTDMKELMKINTLENNIITLTTLVESRYFSLLFDEVFDNKEVKRVYERINQLDKLVSDVQQMNDGMIDDLMKDVKSSTTKDKLKLAIEARNKAN